MPKKLIETALPLEAINAEASREKSIRHGHPSTLHLWWARRPLAAARAVLWASLVDDPSAHPELYPTEEEQSRERKRLHDLLAELVKWENTGNEKLLAEARAEIAKSMGHEKLVFLDPFAGGGSLPLEAQRLGLEAHAHDLNPVAVLINKAMIEIPPKFAGNKPVNPQSRQSLRQSWAGASGLAEDVKYYGEWLKNEAFKRIGHLYPKVKLPEGGEATVIAWIWARTVKCPNPACACEMPLARSFDLSKKRGNEAHIEPVIENGAIGYAVKPGPAARDGTVNRRGAVCPRCDANVSFPYIREEGKAGRMGNRLMAIVADSKNGRIYLAPDEGHENIAHIDKPENFPDGELPHNPRDFKTPNYGMKYFSELFTPRQLTALTTFSELIAYTQAVAEQDAIAAGMADEGIGLADGGCDARAYGQAVGVYLAFVVDKLTAYHSNICAWHSTGEKIQTVFGRQAIPMVWDYAEANPFSSSSGCYDNMLEWVYKSLQEFAAGLPGFVEQCDAQSGPNLENIIISTDPPYYDNIGYADLSDFFYVWLRKSLKNIYPRICATMLTPKREELIATPYRFGGDKQKARAFFEDGMQETFRQLNICASENVPVTIYYAFKQSEVDNPENANMASTGWETMLSALIKAGFAITGTWPMRTEMKGRTLERVGTNALASSIVLVCRKRPEKAGIILRRDFVMELRQHLPDALKKMREANIAPVDLAQAAIGPGMEVYSRYSAVLGADGTPMPVRQALQAINMELDACLNERAGSLDEATRFCMDLYSQIAYGEIRFGEAEVLANAKNISMEKLDHIGVVKAAKGIVRLAMREELPPKPQSDPDACIWLLTQYLALAMQTGGIEATAKLVARYGHADSARELAYRLYALCERKGWSNEAYAFNCLVSSWPEVTLRAAELARGTMVQGELGQGAGPERARPGGN